MGSEFFLVLAAVARLAAQLCCIARSQDEKQQDGENLHDSMCFLSFVVCRSLSSLTLVVPRRPYRSVSPVVVRRLSIAAAICGLSSLGVFVGLFEHGLSVVLRSWLLPPIAVCFKFVVCRPDLLFVVPKSMLLVVPCRPYRPVFVVVVRRLSFVVCDGSLVAVAECDLLVVAAADSDLLLVVVVSPRYSSRCWCCEWHLE